MNGDGPFGVSRPDQDDEIDVDHLLIALKTKEIEEQIRSNKVIEGLLRDIHAAISTIGDKE